jgi:RNA polymerase sigma factor (sigma-70 family)
MELSIRPPAGIVWKDVRWCRLLLSSPMRDFSLRWEYPDRCSVYQRGCIGILGCQTAMTGVLGGIEACIPALRRYAGTLLRDRQEVDDLVHDCLVRALEKLDTHRENEDLRAWLFAIMHNLFISKMRRSKARAAVLSEVDAEEDPLILNPIQDLHVEAGDLLRAVENLPEQQRSVLALVVLEDMSYSQVADILGVPIGTVMSRLARARNRLATSAQVVAPPSRLRRVK